jgi:hypothetical protein
MRQFGEQAAQRFRRGWKMRFASDHGPLIWFAFVSTVLDVVPPAALVRMERQVWEFNVRNRITGRMALRAGRIRQALEGDASVVLPLVARILSDERHSDISITGFRVIKARRFTGWRSLGFAAGTPQVCAEADAAVHSGNVFAFRRDHNASLPRVQAAPREAVSGSS